METKRAILKEMKIALEGLNNSEEKIKTVLGNINEIEERMASIIKDILKLCKTYEGIMQFRTGRDPGKLLEKLEHLAELEARYLRLLNSQYEYEHDHPGPDEYVKELLQYNFPNAKGKIAAYFDRLDHMVSAINDAFSAWRKRSEYELEFVKGLRITLVDKFMNTLHDVISFQKRDVMQRFRNDFSNLVKVYKESSSEKTRLARKLAGDDAKLVEATQVIVRLLSNKKERLRDVQFEFEDSGFEEMTKRYVEQKTDHISNNAEKMLEGAFRGAKLGALLDEPLGGAVIGSFWQKRK
jgi:hypothetical protein